MKSGDTARLSVRNRRVTRVCRLLLIVGLAAHVVSSHTFVGTRSPKARAPCINALALPGSRTLRHEVGDIVEVRCEDDGQWYQAIVEHENSDGTFTVRFDKDGFEYHYPLVAWRVPKTRHFIEELDDGEVLNGRVTDISSTGFYVDVGAEDEGFVHISEIKESRVAKIEDEVKIGQEVTVRVLSTSNGKLTLSMKPAGSSDSTGLAAFKDLPPDMFLRATITETPAFGAFAMVSPPAGDPSGSQKRGLIHISQMGRGFVASVEDQVSVGQEVLVSVLSTEGGRLSLRLEENEESRIEIDKGTWLTGSVIKTMSYGAFVKVQWQGQDKVGLLHVSEMADDFIVNCSTALSVGDNVTVQLLHNNKGRTSWTARTERLSEEELEPFAGLSRKDSLTGLVQHICDGGAYVLLAPPEGGIAVQGVLWRQEMELKDGEAVEDLLTLGKEVQVTVKSADNGRLLLSAKQLQIPSAFSEIPENLWVKGVVKDLHDYGAFVMVQAPQTKEEYVGLLHVSQTGNRLMSELKVGQEVSVRIMGVDGFRLSLSMKPPVGSKERPILQDVEADQWLEATIKEARRFGAVAEVQDPVRNKTVLGRIHITEMSDGYLDSVDEVLTVNQSVKVRLLKRNDLSFSLRPWRRAEQSLVALNYEQPLRGKVLNVSHSGAAVIQIVEPAAGVLQRGSSGEDDKGEIHGYLHPTELNESIKQNLTPGAEVHCRILSVQGDKLALTMRSPSESFKDFAECQDVLNGVVQEVTALGIFVRLQPPCGGPAVQGLVHLSFLEDNSDYSEGDMVKVKVVHASNSSLLLSLAD